MNGEPGQTAAALLARGVRRCLAEQGYRSLTEFTLANGRRADVFAVNGAGALLIVEVKSGVADFRSDQKWPEYQAYCDRFAFAVDAEFPHALIPPECGLLVADGYGAAWLRDPPEHKLAPARRRALLLAVALAACARLQRVDDPGWVQSVP